MSSYNLSNGRFADLPRVVPETLGVSQDDWDLLLNGEEMVVNENRLWLDYDFIKVYTKSSLKTFQVVEIWPSKSSSVGGFPAMQTVELAILHPEIALATMSLHSCCEVWGP